MLLYIVRHGDPDYVTDSLTERGKQQAEAVGKRICDSHIDRIFSSPMGRALETAEPACRLLGLTCDIEEWTHEIGDERLTPFPDGKRKSLQIFRIHIIVKTEILTLATTRHLPARELTSQICSRLLGLLKNTAMSFWKDWATGKKTEYIRF